MGTNVSKQKWMQRFGGYLGPRFSWASNCRRVIAGSFMSRRLIGGARRGDDCFGAANPRCAWRDGDLPRLAMTGQKSSLQNGESIRNARGTDRFHRIIGKQPVGLKLLTQVYY
jgi:hypothetical protein